MIRSKAIMFLMLGILFLTTAHHIDDSDYSNIDLYEDYPFLYNQNFEKRRPKETPDDFYVVNYLEEADDHSKIYPPVIEDFKEADNRNSIYSTPNKIQQIFFDQDDSINTATSPPRRNWYNVPEKIYRYTKHRIPGYDYDEFDIFGDNSDRKCDEKSVWTHCLCQFTCTEPNSVDCYTPCVSGCECKEDFVFDERTQQCLLPVQCEMGIDYFYDFET